MAKRFECFYCGKPRAARSAYIHYDADGERIGYRCNTRMVKCAVQGDRRSVVHIKHLTDYNSTACWLRRGWWMIERDDVETQDDERRRGTLCTRCDIDAQHERASIAAGMPTTYTCRKCGERRHPNIIVVSDDERGYECDTTRVGVVCMNPQEIRRRREISREVDAALRGRR